MCIPNTTPPKKTIKKNQQQHPPPQNKGKKTQQQQKQRKYSTRQNKTCTIIMLMTPQIKLINRVIFFHYLQGACSRTQWKQTSY